MFCEIPRAAAISEIPFSTPSSDENKSTSAIPEMPKLLEATLPSRFSMTKRFPIKIRKRIARSEHQRNIGARCNGVRPVHVESGFKLPASVHTGSPAIYRAVWREDLEVGRRQSRKFVHAENVFASSTMVFEPKASTITIVPLCLRGQDFSVTCLRLGALAICLRKIEVFVSDKIR
jgi:hypothetical protein